MCLRIQVQLFFQSNQSFSCSDERRPPRILTDGKLIYHYETYGQDKWSMFKNHMGIFCILPHSHGVPSNYEVTKAVLDMSFLDRFHRAKRRIYYYRTWRICWLLQNYAPRAQSSSFLPPYNRLPKNPPSSLRWLSWVRRFLISLALPNTHYTIIEYGESAVFVKLYSKLFNRLLFHPTQPTSKLSSSRSSGGGKGRLSDLEDNFTEATESPYSIVQ